MENFIQQGDLSQLTTYRAGAMQATAHRTLQKHCDAILRPHGITKMQWLIVGTVLDAGVQGIRISDLADALGTNLPFMTNSVNRLEEMGMLVRTDNKHDSRSKLVRVAPDFVGQCEIIETTLRNGLRRSIYRNIDPQEFRVYMKVMHQLSQVDNR